MLRHTLLFLVLLGFWVVLSGHVDLAQGQHRYLFICGLVSCLLATLLARRVGFLDVEGPVFAIFLRQVPYLFWLALQMFKSSWDVTCLVWGSGKRLDPRLVHTPYEMRTELATAIYANSITLTPGTVTIQIDAEKRLFLVHALHEGGPQGLPEMHRRVLDLEGKK